MVKDNIEDKNKEIVEFRKIVWRHFNKNVRIFMPWRETSNAYYVLLSEFMLQQTQVVRVIDYFNRFIKKWDSLEKLCKATLAEILTLWQGLGYYRRAKYLHECAKIIVQDYAGIVPDNQKILLELPGIGEYTSAAIIAFVYNKPIVVLETNIRRAIVYHFYNNEKNISEEKIKQKVEQTMDIKKTRQWYWALMDYGADLSFKVANPNRKTKIYTKQTQFIGSNRQVRAAILRTVINKNNITHISMFNEVKHYLILQGRIEKNVSVLTQIIYKNIAQLTKEKLIVCESATYRLPS